MGCGLLGKFPGRLEAKTDAGADGGVVRSVFGPVILSIGEDTDAVGKTIVKARTRVEGALVHTISVQATACEDVRRKAEAADREAQDQAAESW